MIVRHIILFIALVVLPYLWIDYHYLRVRPTLPLWKRLLCWVPCVVMLIYTARMAHVPDFVPRHRPLTDGYLLLLGLLVIPAVAFSVTTLVGAAMRRFRQPRWGWSERIGTALAVLVAALFLYGYTAGFNRIEVKHCELEFDDLPVAYDGLRIVHVSDLHVGTYTGWRRPVLQAIVDTICSLHPDVVCFTGDLQNTHPEEVGQVKDLLARLPNVYSVLGNHDHGEYVSGTEEEKRAVEEKLKSIQRELGWTLLINESTIIPPPSTLDPRPLPLASRTSSIYPRPSSLDPRPLPLASRPSSLRIIGTDNDGLPPFPALADYGRATRGIVGDTVFTIMLQHDPSAWRRHILSQTTAQLTLSGHTHGGQVAMGGLRPTRMRYREDAGLYQEGSRYLHVSTGAGGLVPIRIGIPNEVTVITLKRGARSEE